MLPPGEKTKLRLNYAKAKLWKTKLCCAKLGQGSITPKLNCGKLDNKFSAAQVSLSSIITAKFSVAKLLKAQFWSHQKKSNQGRKLYFVKYLGKTLLFYETLTAGWNWSDKCAHLFQLKDHYTNSRESKNFKNYCQ